MATVSDQLRAKRAVAATAATPTAKTTTTTRKPAAKPAARTAATKPTAKPRPAARTKPAEPEVVETDEAETTEAAELTPEQKAALKEQKKKDAFAKLKKRAQEKRAAATVARKEQMKGLKGELKVGEHKFLTRASYYGCEVVIEGFAEVRGRNLVQVRVISTKKGTALDEDATYTRQVSPKFLADERPTEAYVKRRGTVTAEVEEEAEEEAEVDETEADDEAEEGADEELEEGDDEDESEDGDDEDSWGEDE